MFTVADVLRRKGARVHTIGRDSSSLAAARQMNAHRIGSLVVMDGTAVVGIITERDILTRLVADQLSPSLTSVSRLMTTEVITCSPQTPLAELRSLMRERRIRHVPVIDRGVLAGLVSIGDLNAAEAEDLAITVRSLEEYITHG